MSAFTTVPMELDERLAEADARQLETAAWLVAGYQQSLNFRAQLTSPAAVDAALRGIGGYNAFNGAGLADFFTEVGGEVWHKVSSVDVGRECSPVLYLHVPFWTHQSIMAQRAGVYSQGEPLSLEERRSFFSWLAHAAKVHKVDELSIEPTMGRGRIWLNSSRVLPVLTDDVMRTLPDRLRMWWD